LSGILTIIKVFAHLVRFSAPQPVTESLTWNCDFCTSLFFGFIEEIPYRGFIMHKFEARYGFWFPNLFSSLLFLCIHLPDWIAFHLLSVNLVISIFIFGTAMSIVFIY